MVLAHLRSQCLQHSLHVYAGWSLRIFRLILKWVDRDHGHNNSTYNNRNGTRWQYKVFNVRFPAKYTDRQFCDGKSVRPIYRAEQQRAALDLTYG